MRHVCSYVVILYVFSITETYKILGIFPICGQSHFTLGFRLMKELADRGHQVSFINCFPQEKPIKNLKDISVESIKSNLLKFYDMSSITQQQKFSFYRCYKGVSYFENLLATGLLKNENIHKLVKSNETFDLVISENFYFEFMTFFAYKFGAPLIMISAGPVSFHSNYIFSNPAPSSYITNLFQFDTNSKMSLWERMENLYAEILGEFYMNFVQIPEQAGYLKQLVPDAPDLKKILYNTSLLLVASHLGVFGPVPLQQNVKEIGGYTIPQPQPLPKPIKDFLDNATEGVVIFSMGSMIKSSNFALDKKNIVLNAFSKIRQKVLWKFEEDLRDIPDNVQIFKWIPQSDVLNHPNVVAFISHGGLLGITESLYYGVPILGIPVFYDQGRNIELAAEIGYALKINYNDLEEKAFEWALNEILNNPKYRDVAKQRSAIMRDQPTKALDEAVFWCEYVVRHRGAFHLRSPAMDLKWYQLYQLDVFLLIFIIISTFILLINNLLKYVIKRMTVTNINDKKDK
ncbi:UDP-glucosyltransferase 2-like [Diorhabda carinulata]|uniref:UDP-glucosyltransferase 2-like n=1 Tax=Diorhabda carinulata TaxID=1163345 RepID=UPI0025A05B24|nr:UDP-glucosyltransferase 2-like [Diorhabda carinulata]